MRRSLSEIARRLYRRVKWSRFAPLVDNPVVRPLQRRLAPQMSATRVIAVIDALRRAGIEAWVFGGWGADALIGHQTRPHRDVDLVIDRTHEPRALEILAGLGFEDCKRVANPGLWVPVKLLLRDRDSVIVDLHPVDIASLEANHRSLLGELGDPQGEAGPFAVGRIAETEVPCLGRALQLATRRGYRARDVDRHDIARLDTGLRD